MLSRQPLLLKVLVVDTQEGGAAFLFRVRSSEMAQNIISRVPSHAEGIFDFLECLDCYQEEGSLELLWEAYSHAEREWIDAYPCMYTIDLRDLSESLFE